MAASTDHLGYDWRPTRNDTGGGREAVFTCNRCGAVIGIPHTHGKRINPEMIAAKATKAGWKVNAFRASVTRCPDCLSRRSPGESPKDTTTMPVIPQESGAALMKAAELRHPQAAAGPVTTDTAATAATVRAPTREQRFAIRHELDRLFDDKAGVYLDGESDKTIANRLNLPWKMVADLREAAYGSIHSDPEADAVIAGLRALEGRVKGDVATLSETIMETAQAFANLQEKMAKEIDGCTKAAEHTEKQLLAEVRVMRERVEALFKRGASR